MAVSAPSRALTIAALAGLCGLGFYSTLLASSTNGLVPALLKATVPTEAEARYCPGAPAPFKDTYTGIAAVDDKLRLLVCFFAIVIDAPQTPDVAWVSGYLGVQLFAGWLLLSLEGLRYGNRGRIVSFTGTLGFFFQLHTYTVCAPIYLIIHLLTSPLSSGSLAPEDLSLSAADVAALPIVATAAYVLPAVVAVLPSPALLAPAVHYSANAFWQVFPVLQSVYHAVATRLFFVPTTTTKKSRSGADPIYRLVLALAVVSQSTLLLYALAPSSSLNLATAFIPHAPNHSPVVAADEIDAAGHGLAELIKFFLQWDIYCGGSAVLVWALYQYRLVVAGVASAVPKVALWTVLGGPVGAAAVLLWERDTVVRDGGVAKKRA